MSDSSTLASHPGATEAHGLGPLDIVVIPLILAANAILAPLGAVVILIWARLSHTPLSDLGFKRPHSWPLTVAVGITSGVALKLLMKVIVMPLLGAPAINQPFHYIARNPAALPGIIYLAIVAAGFGEETLFRGFLFELLGRLFGSSIAAKGSIVVITAVLFGLAHYSNQGIPGVEQATIFGLVLGTIFAITGRIWMLMIAHAAFDLTAIAIIYWNYESAVAHLVFR